MVCWAEVPALARKGEQILMPATRALHPRKAIIQNAAVKVSANVMITKLEKLILLHCNSLET